jgi:hypothetical protein
MRLLLEYRDTTGQYSNYTVGFQIRNNRLAQLWLNHLIINLFDSDHLIEKTYCLHGWQTDWYSTRGRNLTYLCQQLNNSIAEVNTGMRKHGYPNIDLHYDVEILRSDSYRTVMNEIHHHFEMLIGQVWNPSKWMKLADEHTKFHIRQLNNLCHEIESAVNSICETDTSKHTGVSMMGLDEHGEYFHNKLRTELTINEYSCFQQDSMSWTGILLYYSQLGKSHYEAFADNDQHIDHENISSMRYVTGEFTFPFNREAVDVIYPQEFYDWLKVNNFDITDKTLGIGFPVVADIDSNYTPLELRTELLKRDDLYKIHITQDDGTPLRIRTFDYTWQDEVAWTKKS